jgi:CRISPR type III-A-associated RAMP protein Csm4
MNPGLVVKLRPSGPWRIGPDSGARNRVDVIYHSDSLYSAVTGAMSRMGSLSAWLDATARSQTPAACFSSCFPFLDDIGFVVPPRTIWPPTSPAAMSARVRWKSARFVPLNLVESMLAGKRLNDNQWSVDGASGCLVPAGKAGPFRTSVRWNAAVDRLSGASERHGTACIEFREGCGLWTVVGFADEAARDRWQDPVKAAFRLLADSGFGGERSRGWGRSETPEFVEGTLPGLIIEYKGQSPSPPVEEPPTEEPPIEEPPPTEEPVPDPNPPMEADSTAAGTEVAGVNEVSAGEPLPHGRGSDEAIEVAVSDAKTEVAAEGGAEAIEVALSDATTEVAAGEPLPHGRGSDESVPEIEAALSDATTEPVAGEPLPHGRGSDDAVPETEVALSEATIEAEVRAPDLTEPMRVPAAAAGVNLQAHWLLSLFTPAAEDTVDWGRGSYSVLARGGRIDSPSGSGELKKQIQMVAEGSVLYANGIPMGAAADVAPDGFAHPVFRSGFALAIPLPEVH